MIRVWKSSKDHEDLFVESWGQTPVTHLQLDLASLEILLAREQI